MILNDSQPQQNPTASSQDQAQALVQQVRQLERLLLSQQESLRRQAMSLPAESLNAITGLKTQAEALFAQVTHNHNALKQLRALAHTTALVNSILDTNEVLNQVMDTVIRFTGAERGFIMLKDPNSGELVFRTARGIEREKLQEDQFMVSTTIVNQVAATGTPELTNNASDDPRYRGNQSIVGYALRSIIAVPLKVRGEVIGVVYCDNRIMAGVFKVQDLNLVTAFANQAGIAIENARLFEDARTRLNQVKETTDFISNVLESIASGVLTLDNKGFINLSNAMAEAIIAHPAGEIDGHRLYDLLPVEIRELCQTAVAEVCTTGYMDALSLEPVVQGEKRIWNMVISPLQGYNDESPGVAIVLDDLTELRRREAQLNEVQRYLPLALVKNIRAAEVLDIGGQERLITSISADVRGFTTFSERLEPETLMQTINRYLSLASDAINLYEGVVDKFMGDAVTGLFNTQLHPQEDHALRAVRAAWNLIYDLHALHEVLPEEHRLYYGVGIHTGMAVLGNVGSPGRKEFAAIGEATGISKVLEANAKGGEIVISPATYEWVQDEFECEAFPLEKNKGYLHLTEAYRVLGRKKRSAPLSLDDFDL
jgi:adenylate cyclase